jgi:phosphatidylinositol kinase/protein kinase (PI-3  family)
MPCFENIETSIVVNKFVERFYATKNQMEFQKIVNDLIYHSYNNFWTNKYDLYQKMTNGIIP